MFRLEPSRRKSRVLKRRVSKTGSATVRARANASCPAEGSCVRSSDSANSVDDDQEMEPDCLDAKSQVS
jgi:hypothetical protein